MPIVIAEQAAEYLKVNNHTDEETAITSLDIATGLKVESNQVSWGLSSQFKNGKPTILRRAKAQQGRGWVYWIGTRSAKSKPLRTRTNGKTKHSKPQINKLAPGIGIYFCREDAEDIMLTFKEAKAMYDQLTVVFG